MMALKYKEGTSTTDHASEFQSVMNQLLGMVRNREKDGKGKDKSRSKSRSRYKNLKCHHCAKKDHIKKYCFKWKREKKGGGGGDKHGRNDEEKSERTTATREDLLVICDENLVNLACDKSSWVINTGVSIHVTSRRDFFASYTPDDFGY
ncbi:hypothetical protein V6N11_060272 [Hibiscus sabdariffa]|uniref:Uncharacterized protein n=2 Tax=Hibiscus sabdariffa TaxID=183260 RepID=A0ABR2QPY7_9ROSI